MSNGFAIPFGCFSFLSVSTGVFEVTDVVGEAFALLAGVKAERGRFFGGGTSVGYGGAAVARRVLATAHLHHGAAAVPPERAALDGEAVLFLEATKQLGTMLNSCSSSLKNL